MRLNLCPLAATAFYGLTFIYHGPRSGGTSGPYCSFFFAVAMRLSAYRRASCFSSWSFCDRDPSPCTQVIRGREAFFSIAVVSTVGTRRRAAIRISVITALEQVEG